MVMVGISSFTSYDRNDTSRGRKRCVFDGIELICSSVGSVVWLWLKILKSLGISKVLKSMCRCAKHSFEPRQS